MGLMTLIPLSLSLSVSHLWFVVYDYAVWFKKGELGRESHAPYNFPREERGPDEEIEQCS